MEEYGLFVIESKIEDGQYLRKVEDTEKTIVAAISKLLKKQKKTL